MARYLIVDFVKETGRQEIGRISQGQVQVGREPGEGEIKVDASAVSRVHGIFMRQKNHWFYQDQGSTNGSWVNGVKVSKGSWRLVRPGDIIQLADAALQLREQDDGQPSGSSLSEFPNLGGRSLIVFLNGEFVDEFPVPEYGRALVIGGSSSDIELEGDLYEQPSLVAERRGENVVVYSVAKELPLLLNGEGLADITNLKDGDEVRLSSYTIIFNDPANAPARGQPDGTTQIEHPEPKLSRLRGWFDDDKPKQGGPIKTEPIEKGKQVRGSLFGQRLDEDHEESDETFAMDLSSAPSGMMGMHPTMRTSAYHRPEQNRQYSFTSLEDKIILGVGFALLLALIGLVIWWALSS